MDTIITPVLTTTYLEEIEKILGFKCIISGETGANYHYSIYRLIQKGTDGRNPIAIFKFGTFKGCCGIVISCGNHIKEEYRNKGLGKLINELKTHLAFQARYSLVLCTDKVLNEPQQRILKSNGWEELYKFKNIRSSNRVSVHCIEAKPGRYRLDGIRWQDLETF